MKHEQLLGAILILAIAIPNAYAALGQDLLLVFNSSSNVSDISGNGFNHTIFGSPIFGCTNGSGVCNFTTSNYVSRNPGIVYYNEFLNLTAFVGFNITSGATGDITLAANGNASFGQNTFSMQYRSSAGKIVAGLYNGSEYETFSCDVDFTPDSEYHVFAWSYNAATRDATCMLDGVTTTNRSSIPTAGGSDRHRIGVRQDATSPMNGTIFFYGLDRRVYNTSDFEELALKNYNWYSNITPVPTYVNLTIGNLSRVIEDNWFGFHTGREISFPTYINATGGSSYTLLRNQTADLATINALGFTGTRWRMDADLENLCATKAANGSCNWPTTNTSNDFNIQRSKNMVALADQYDAKIHIIFEAMPQELASPIPECNYAAAAPNFDYISCPTNNMTDWADRQYQLLDVLGCFTTYNGTCVVERWNEPYLRTYWLRNTSTSCDRATALIVDHERNSTAALRTRAGANYSYIAETWGMSVNVGFSACGINMTRDILRNFTQGVEFDYVPFHEYDSSADGNLVDEYAAAQANATAYGWSRHWGLTETNRNNNNFDAVTDVYLANIGFSNNYLLSSTFARAILYYPLTCNNLISSSACEDYIAFSPPQLDNVIRAPGLLANATKYSRDAAVVYKVYSTNSNLNAVLVKLNATNSLLYVANYINDSVLIQNVTFTDANITSATLLNNGTVQTVNSGRMQPQEFTNYEFLVYNITTTSIGGISFNVTSPSQTVNITLPSTQGFSATIANPDNLTTYYSWFVNGVNQTSVYGQTSATVSAPAGTYNVTVEVYSMANTISYSWTLNVAAAASATVCTSSAQSSDGLVSFSRFFDLIVLSIVLVSLITVIYGVYDQRNMVEIVELVLGNCLKGVIAVVVVSVVVAVGSTAVLTIGAC